MKIHLKYIVFIVLISLVTACSPAPAAPVELTKTSIQLSWVHEYSAAPFHSAVKEGYFAAQGIDATLVEGGFSEAGYIDPRQEVVDGTVDFGMTSGSSLIEAVNDGLPVIGVANILQRSPLALMTLDGGIRSLQDIPGHSILVADGGARDALESLLVSQNIALDSVTIVPRTDFGVDPLVNGDVDALVAWRINEGVALEEADLNPTFFLFSDYGVENYEFVLFTSKQIVETKPELVQGVVNALHLGRDFVVASPSVSIDHTMSYAPDLNRDQQLRRLEATIPLLEVGDVNHLTMNQDIWEFSYQLMLTSNLIDEGFDVSTVYTNQFAQKTEDLELR